MLPVALQTPFGKSASHEFCDSRYGILKEELTRFSGKENVVAQQTFLEIVEELEKNNKISVDEATLMRSNYEYFNANCGCIDGTFSGWAAGLNQVLYIDTSSKRLEQLLRRQSNWQCAYVVEIFPSA